MPEYSINLATRFSDAAVHLIRSEINDPEAGRATLYLSLLASELALKSMLEQAGMPILEIREYSHQLNKLLWALDKCNAECIDPSVGNLKVSASQLRAKVIEFKGGQITVGKIIETPQSDVSTYPSCVRYGQDIRHYPPKVLAIMAEIIVHFANNHLISLKPSLE